MKKKKQEKIEYTSEEEKREKHFQSLFPKEKEKKKRKKTAVLRLSTVSIPQKYAKTTVLIKC